jgi:succinate-semialdehyde dehydrogenase / glutarate-semialdehyde dehydrogenase
MRGQPLIDDSQLEKVSKLVEDALGKGAKALVGAEKTEGVAYFYRPAVLNDVPPNRNLLKEEIVGPVAPVASFGSEEEAVAAANDRNTASSPTSTRTISRVRYACAMGH